MKRGYQVETLPGSGSITYGDGWDSPAIWDDLLDSASPANPFGIAFDLNNLTFTSGVGATVAPTDSLLYGPAGNPVAMEFHNGASLTLNLPANANVRGVLFKPGAATTSTTGAMVAHTRYGRGRVAALGDSSPPDDGTGAPGKRLYDDWAAEANGDHARLLLNATIWLHTQPHRHRQPPRHRSRFQHLPQPQYGRFFHQRQRTAY